MNPFRQVVFSSGVMNALMLAVSLFLFITTMSKRSRRTNIVVGSAIIICALLATVFSIRAYQLSY